MSSSISKITNCALLGVVGYLAYKLVTQEKSLPPVQDVPLSGNLSGLSGLSSLTSDTEMYAMDTVPFVYLDERTKTMLLQCFAQDYTSPRMIKDDALYNKAVSCANRTGCPCGWVQYVLDKQPGINLDNAALAMLDYCDYAIKNSDQVLLDAIRSNAINVALSGQYVGYVE